MRSYYSRASGKKEVLDRINSKLSDLRIEVHIYEQALNKIKGLEEGSFYEIEYISGNKIPFNLFVQCRTIGRDRILFRVFAFDVQESLAPLAMNTANELSLMWHWDWKVKPPLEPACYVGWVSHTDWFTKLIAGKYKTKEAL